MIALLNQGTKTEKQLLQLAAGGCETSFSQLFFLYKDKLYTFFILTTKSKEQSLDFVQDIFMKLWINRGSLAAVENFGSYIFRCAQNHAVNGFRRSMTESSVIAKIQSFQLEADYACREFELRFLEERLHSVINKLPPQQKLVYTLSRVEGLTYDEIATQLHISQSTVKGHMVRALYTIKEFLRKGLNITEGFLVLIFIRLF